MAIYRPGPIIGAISGKLGAAVFVNARGSHVIRKIPTKKRPRTKDQLDQLALAREARFEWDDMSDNLRDQWDTYAASHPSTNRLGITRAATGRQTFYSAFMNKAFYPFGIVVQYPPAPVPDPLTAISLSITQGGPYNITLTPTTLDLFVAQSTEICRPFRAAPMKYWKPWKFLNTSASANPTRDFQDEIEEKVGPLVTGEVVAVRCRRGAFITAIPGPPVSTYTTVL